jgi:2-polyprenyl-3-methyl-5-hydroxy-6-metoxy-1,4-benzoquinol methylase
MISQLANTIHQLTNTSLQLTNTTHKYDVIICMSQVVEPVEQWGYKVAY